MLKRTSVLLTPKVLTTFPNLLFITEVLDVGHMSGFFLVGCLGRSVRETCLRGAYGEGFAAAVAYANDGLLNN